MKKIKQLKNWGIYQNNSKEILEYGFEITILHPDNMEYPYLCSPRDTDMEMETIEQAVSWIKNY